MTLREDELYQAVINALNKAERSANVLVSSNQYRKLNIQLAFLTSPIGLICGIVGWEERCDAPLAILLVLTGSLPLFMAIFLAVLMYLKKGYESQSIPSHVVGAFFLGVRAVSQVYFWGSPRCSDHLFWGSLFYILLDFVHIGEAICMHNIGFVRGFARRLQVSLPEDEEDTRELQSNPGSDSSSDDDDDSDDDVEKQQNRGEITVAP